MALMNGIFGKSLGAAALVLAVAFGYNQIKGMADPCAGITLLSTSHFFINTTVRVQNMTDERRLVTFSLTDPFGFELATPELWVAARDITEASLQNADRNTLAIKHCE